MRVFGYATDHQTEWKVPFPTIGEGWVFTSALAAALIASAFLFGSLLLAVLGILASVVLFLGGAKVRLLGGDLLSPDTRSGRVRPGREAEGRNWFTVVPGTVERAVYEKPRLVFISVRIRNFGFYAGHKVFGVDSDSYKDYPLVAPEDVYDGSIAMSGFSFRASTKVGIPK